MFTLTALSVLLLSPPSQSEKSITDEIHKHFTERAGKGFSGVILVIRDGKVLLHEAYGLKDREKKVPTTKDLPFDIGSIVKPLTAASIYTFVTEGKLSLTDALPKFFDNVPEDKRNITIQQILRHRGGIVDTIAGDYTVIPKEQFIQRVLAAKLVAEPGSKSIYSNSGYSLLAAVIEKLSGQSYEQYVHDHFVKPTGARLGYSLPRYTSEELPVGYRRGQRWGTSLDHPWDKDGPSWTLRGNGGMIATAMDLYRVFQSIEDGKSLSPPALDLFRGHYHNVTPSGVKVMSVAGGNGVFNVVYVLVPSKRFTLIGMSSVGEENVEKSREQFREWLGKVARLP